MTDTRTAIPVDGTGISRLRVEKSATLRGARTHSSFTSADRRERLRRLGSVQRGGAAAAFRIPPVSGYHPGIRELGHAVRSATLRTAWATALAVFLVLVALGCGWMHLSSLPFGAPHASSAPAQPTHGSIYAHDASADQGLAPRCSKLLATTAATGQALNPAGLGMVAALGVATGVWAPHVVPAGRGPPRAPRTVLAGRDLLTRLGISRR